MILVSEWLGMKKRMILGNLSKLNKNKWGQYILPPVQNSETIHPKKTCGSS